MEFWISKKGRKEGRKKERMNEWMKEVNIESAAYLFPTIRKFASHLCLLEFRRMSIAVV